MKVSRTSVLLLACLEAPGWSFPVHPSRCNRQTKTRQRSTAAPKVPFLRTKTALLLSVRDDKESEEEFERKSREAKELFEGMNTFYDPDMMMVNSKDGSPDVSHRLQNYLEELNRETSSPNSRGSRNPYSGFQGSNGTTNSSFGFNSSVHHGPGHDRSPFMRSQPDGAVGGSNDMRNSDFESPSAHHEPVNPVDLPDDVVASDMGDASKKLKSHLEEQNKKSKKRNSPANLGSYFGGLEDTADSHVDYRLNFPLEDEDNPVGKSSGAPYFSGKQSQPTAAPPQDPSRDAAATSGAANFNGNQQHERPAGSTQGSPSDWAATRNVSVEPEVVDPYDTDNSPPWLTELVKNTPFDYSNTDIFANQNGQERGGKRQPLHKGGSRLFTPNEKFSGFGGEVYARVEDPTNVYIDVEVSRGSPDEASSNDWKDSAPQDDKPIKPTSQSETPKYEDTEFSYVAEDQSESSDVLREPEVEIFDDISTARGRNSAAASVEDFSHPEEEDVPKWQQEVSGSASHFQNLDGSPTNFGFEDPDVPKWQQSVPNRDPTVPIDPTSFGSNSIPDFIVQEVKEEVEPRVEPSMQSSVDNPSHTRVSSCTNHKVPKWQQSEPVHSSQYAGSSAHDPSPNFHKSPTDQEPLNMGGSRLFKNGQRVKVNGMNGSHSNVPNGMGGIQDSKNFEVYNQLIRQGKMTFEQAMAEFMGEGTGVPGIGNNPHGQSNGVHTNNMYPNDIYTNGMQSNGVHGAHRPNSPSARWANPNIPMSKGGSRLFRNVNVTFD